MWKDINQKTESFSFKHRVIAKVDVVLSSFYDYETSHEMKIYKIMNNGKDMERLSPIFIAFFPYKEKTLLLMGHAKEDESKLKGYFNSFFKESEKRVQRKITNLMLFQCENWVCSESFYKKRIKGKENIFGKAPRISSLNMNERKVFDLNIFRDDFDTKLEKWNNEYGR